MAIAPMSRDGQALVGITISMLILSWITLLLRFWVRKRINSFGIDDLLMAIGVILYTIAAQSMVHAAYSGLGTPDKYLNNYYQRQGRKWFFWCSVVYALATVAIKCSICACMLRIAIQKRYRVIMYTVMVLSAIASFTASLTLLVWCHPIAANWDPRAGTCPPQQIISHVGFYFSATSILTDWTCAILPGFVLWDTKLAKRVKISIIVLLALGVVASLTTLVRFAYLDVYNKTDNYLYSFAPLSLWTMLECGLGIVGGSVATLRPLFRMVVTCYHSSCAEKDIGSTSDNLNPQDSGHLSRNSRMVRNTNDEPGGTGYHIEASDTQF